MFNNKHDTIQELLRSVKYRDRQIVDLGKRLLSQSDSQLAVSALGHVEQLVRDKARATKIPNGAALTEAQELFRLADSLASAALAAASAVNYNAWSFLVTDNPIAAVLGGSAE